MRKKFIIYILFSVIIISLIIIITFLNPLRRSEEKIKISILKLIPIETSMEDVIKIIEKNKKWETRYINENNGYSIWRGHPSEPSFSGIGTIIEKKSIRLYLGKYGIIFQTGVSVYFGFDENSKLIDIAVRKDIDSV